MGPGARRVVRGQCGAQNGRVSSRFGPSGAPDETTVFPNHFEIDYVRIWQAPKSVIAAEPPAKAKPAEVPSIIAVLPASPLP